VRDEPRDHRAARAAERRTPILEKFEHRATSAAYAVVLLAEDDMGRSRLARVLRPRARQNVIFELGFLFGRLGRSHVSVIRDSGVEKPSDIDGLVYIPHDRAGTWKKKLGDELKTPVSRLTTPAWRSKGTNGGRTRATASKPQSACAHLDGASSVIPWRR
jgi:predicted nucleotide-binding protein